jgi:hypothetical protein
VSTDELAGRALDAAIARDLFDCEVVERINANSGERDWVSRKPGEQWLRVPFYGASLSASLTIEVELQRRGWKRRERTVSGPATPATVVLVHADGRSVEAEGATLGEALCRAVVKATAP